MLAKGWTDEKLLEMLEIVNLVYVVKRYPRGLDAVQDWTAVLSGGEKQRSGMARLFYHRPKFAILGTNGSNRIESNSVGGCSSSFPSSFLFFCFVDLPLTLVGVCGSGRRVHEPSLGGCGRTDVHPREEDRNHSPHGDPPHDAPEVSHSPSAVRRRWELFLLSDGQSRGGETQTGETIGGGRGSPGAVEV